MPKPPPKRRRLDLNAVVDEAARLCDEVGIERLSLSALADRLGIRPPSLYNHVKNLDDLYQKMSMRGLREFTLAVEKGLAKGVKGTERPVMAIAKATRKFARAHPTLFMCATRDLKLPLDEKVREGKHLMDLTREAFVAEWGDSHRAEIGEYLLRCLTYGFLILEANNALLPAQGRRLERLYEEIISLVEGSMSG